jgi:hypothetical protein
MPGTRQHKAGHDELEALSFGRISNQAVARMSESDIREANSNAAPGFRFAHPGYDFSADEMQAGVHPNQFAGHVA